MFIGTALFAYYKINTGILPTNLSSDEVFPYFIMTKLPFGIVGLVLAALLAAAISTLTADLNCLSAICVGDYYNRIKPNSTEKQRMLVSRLVIILAGLACILIATHYTKIGGEGALGTIFLLYSIFSGGIAGLFLLGIFCKRANKKGAYIGIAASILFTAYAVLTSTPLEIGAQKRLIMDLGSFNYTHHKLLIGVYSHIVLFVVGYFTSFFFKNTRDISHLTFQWWQMKVIKQN
jgi:SSS family solute:Na+ symporter